MAPAGPRPPRHCPAPPHRSTLASSSQSPGSSPRSAPTATRLTGTPAPSSRLPGEGCGFCSLQPSRLHAPSSRWARVTQPTPGCLASAGGRRTSSQEEPRDGASGCSWPARRLPALWALLVSLRPGVWMPASRSCAATRTPSPGQHLLPTGFTPRWTLPSWWPGPQESVLREPSPPRTRWGVQRYAPQPRG